MAIIDHGAGQAAAALGLAGGISGITQGIKNRHTMDLQLEQAAQKRQQLEIMLQKAGLEKDQTLQSMDLQLDEAAMRHERMQMDRDEMSLRGEQVRANMEVQNRQQVVQEEKLGMIKRGERLEEEQRQAATTLGTLRLMSGDGSIPDDPNAVILPDTGKTEIAGVFAPPVNPTEAEMNLFPSLSPKDQVAFVAQYESMRANARYAAMSEALAIRAADFSGMDPLYAPPPDVMIPEVAKLQAAIAKMGDDFDDLAGKPGAYGRAWRQLGAMGEAVRHAISAWKVKSNTHAEIMMARERSTYDPQGKYIGETAETARIDNIIEQSTRADSLLRPAGALALVNMTKEAHEDISDFHAATQEAVRRSMFQDPQVAEAQGAPPPGTGTQGTRSAGVPVQEWVQGQLGAAEDAMQRGDKGAHLQASGVRSLQRKVRAILNGNGSNEEQKNAVAEALKEAGVQVQPGDAGIEELAQLLALDTNEILKQKKLEASAPKTPTMRRADPGGPLN